MYIASVNFIHHSTHTDKQTNKLTNKKNPTTTQKKGHLEPSVKLVGIHKFHIPNSNITLSFLVKFRHSVNAHRQIL